MRMMAATLTDAVSHELCEFGVPIRNVFAASYGEGGRWRLA